MITLTLLLLTLFIIGIIVLISIGAVALSFWWVILIVLDIAICIGLIRCICKLFKKKK